MADEVTKKDLQSLQGWVNAELKKRDAAIDKKRDQKGSDDARSESDLKSRLDRIEGGSLQALKIAMDLEKEVAKLRMRLEKVENRPK